MASSTNNAGGPGDARILPDTFPAKAYLMIESCDRDCSDVASWTDNGRAFVVKDTTKLASGQLPRYFKHSNFQSFVRQLNIYGFRKDAATSESRDVVFRHEKFLKGEEDLLDLIQRAKRTTKKKSATTKRSPAVGLTSSAEEEKVPFETSEPTLLSLQMQIAEMSAKIDILLSISSNERSRCTSSNAAAAAAASAAASAGLVPAGKKRRHDGYAISDASDSDNDHDNEYDQQRSDSCAQMDVLEEEKTDNLDLIDYEVASQESVGIVNADDLTDLIDTMLGDDGILLDGRKPSSQGDDDDDISALDDTQLQLSGDQSRLRGLEQDNNTVLRTDEAATKVAPLPIEGEEQQYSAGNDGTVDAVITHAERVDNSDDDLENGRDSNDAPVAQAVPLTEDRHWAFRPLRGFRLFVAIVVILVLITFIVWPAVVFTSRSRAEEQKAANLRPMGWSHSRSESWSESHSWSESEDHAEGGDGDGDGHGLEDTGSGNDGSGGTSFNGETLMNETAATNGTRIEGKKNQTDQVPPLDEKKLFVRTFIKPQVIEKVPDKGQKDSPMGSDHRISIDDIRYQCTPVGQV